LAHNIITIDTVEQGWRTSILSRAALIVDYRWWATKSIIFVLKFYLYVIWGRGTSFD